MCCSQPGPEPVFSTQVGRPRCQAVECWLQTLALLIFLRTLGGLAWDPVSGFGGCDFTHTGGTKD